MVFKFLFVKIGINIGIGKKKKKIMFEDIIFLINIFNYNIVSNRIIISNFNLFSCLISKSFICNLFL